MYAEWCRYRENTTSNATSENNRYINEGMTMTIEAVKMRRVVE